MRLYAGAYVHGRSEQASRPGRVVGAGHRLGKAGWAVREVAIGFATRPDFVACLDLAWAAIWAPPWAFLWACKRVKIGPEFGLSDPTSKNTKYKTYETINERINTYESILMQTSVK